jgi:hypothetical protein
MHHEHVHHSRVVVLEPITLMPYSLRNSPKMFLQVCGNADPHRIQNGLTALNNRKWDSDSNVTWQTNFHGHHKQAFYSVVLSLEFI